MAPGLSIRHPAFQRARLIAAGTCLLLAIVHTWPLITDPGTLSRNDNGDAQLNEWILAWVAHQLPYAPARLFDANIFYPAKDALAFSEPLIVPAVLGMPLRWLGGSPVFVFNIVLILGFALTAFAAYVLVHNWTGDHAAGLVAGSLFAFNSHTLTRLAHLQGIHAWGLPLALLAVDRVIVRARVKDGVWLAVWMAAMAYTSGYLVVFGSVIVGVVVLVRIPDWCRRAKQVVPVLGLAVLTAGLASVPIYLPYRRVAVEQGLVRTLESVEQFSATLTGYLASAGRLHYPLWSRRLFNEPIAVFFPGFVALLLASLAVVWTLSDRRTSAPQSDMAPTRYRVVALIAMVVVGVILSLGTRTPAYGWLFNVFPPVQALRAPARFGNLFLLGVAALAGIGLARVRSRLPAPRGRVLAIAAVALVSIESLRAPFTYARFEGIPAIYSLVRQAPGRVVLAEVPFYPANLIFQNGTYVLNSTAHFKPLMNGYSGYIPAAYRRYAEAFQQFPELQAVLAMREAGVTHVMVHPVRFNLNPEGTVQLMERALQSPLLERVAIGQEGITLFRVK